MDTNEHFSSLVKKATQKDAESARVLYEHLVEKVFPFVRYRTNTKDDALDITQEVFIDFFSNIENFSYQSQAQLYAFVFVITRRKLSRYYEKQKSEPIEFDEERNGEVVVTADLQSELRLVLESLDDRLREIIELHHFGKYTFAEIAVMLNMTETAVRVAHHRVLVELRSRFKNSTT
jgi:RNA polymerase sigma-70 factor (ECF subfamily)